eukprot:g9246.t1
MGDGLSRAPPKSSEKPPAWHEIEARPHLIEEPDHIPLPRDPPLQSVEGHYLVSQAQRAYEPGLQVGDGIRQNLVASFEDEFKLQRKTTTWGIFDILEGHRVAEMRLRYHACTTPAAIEEPHVADVQQTEVTVRWAPPKNDHGAQVIGYRISILLDPKPNEPPQWYTLCECTSGKNPVYVVANLKGNTAYLLDIRAVNKVGYGDAYEYQIRMRKILGASRWNPFGPGEAAASWVEMGSVAAAGDAAMYNAWVGPLEAGACEYRFQIAALNKLGESKASEMSEPHYT